MPSWEYCLGYDKGEFDSCIPMVFRILTSLACPEPFQWVLRLLILWRTDLIINRSSHKPKHNGMLRQWREMKSTLMNAWWKEIIYNQMQAYPIFKQWLEFPVWKILLFSFEKKKSCIFLINTKIPVFSLLSSWWRSYKISMRSLV